MRQQNLESSSASARRLAQALPDTPGWVDTRGMLLSGRATISTDDADRGFVLQTMSGALAVVSVVGYPSHAVIAQAIEGATDMTPVIAQRDNASQVGQALDSCPPSSSGQQWTPERAILHCLASPTIPELADDGLIRLLRADEPLDHLPPGLRFEIDHARAMAPVAVALIDARPVSFCYPCWITEALWDVSIDTVDGYRRRGLAARAGRFMIALMKAEGREPVWGAMESNVASLELARKLGFTPVDEMVVFSRGPWANFTRGYQPESR